MSEDKITFLRESEDGVQTHSIDILDREDIEKK